MIVKQSRIDGDLECTLASIPNNATILVPTLESYDQMQGELIIAGKDNPVVLLLPPSTVTRVLADLPSIYYVPSPNYRMVHIPAYDHTYTLFFEPVE